MQTVHRTPAFTVSNRPVAELDADLVVIPIFEGDDLSDEPSLEKACGGEIARARGRGGRLLPGSFASSRATLLHSPSTRPRSSAAPTAADVAGRRSSTDSRNTRGGSPVLYEAPSKFARVTPSAITCVACSGVTTVSGRWSTAIRERRR